MGGLTKALRSSPPCPAPGAVSSAAVPAERGSGLGVWRRAAVTRVAVLSETLPARSSQEWLRIWHPYLYLGVECGSPGFCWLFPLKDDVIYCHLLYKTSLRAVCKMCWLLRSPCRACECPQRQFMRQQPELRTPVSQNRQTLLHLSFFWLLSFVASPSWLLRVSEELLRTSSVFVRS